MQVLRMRVLPGKLQNFSVTLIPCMTNSMQVLPTCLFGRDCVVAFFLGNAETQPLPSDTNWVNRHAKSIRMMLTYSIGVIGRLRSFKTTRGKNKKCQRG